MKVLLALHVEDVLSKPTEELHTRKESKAKVVSVEEERPCTVTARAV